MSFGRSIFVVLASAFILTPLMGGTKEISESTLKIGARPNGTIHAWLFLRDKPRSLALASDQFVISKSSQSRRILRATLSRAEMEEIDRSVSLDYLSRIRSRGANIRRVSRWLNAVSVEVSAEQLRELAQFDFIREIRPVRQTSISPLPDVDGAGLSGAVTRQLPKTTIDYGAAAEQLSQINVPPVHDRGYSGAGITVLMLDTGYYQGHESVDSSRIIDQHDFIENDGNTENETFDEGRTGQHNHGTYTYSTLGGNVPETFVGPAYNVSFLLAKTEAVSYEQPSEEDNFVAGLEWGEGLGADLVSSSLGYTDWYTFADMDGNTAVTTLAVRIATRLGLIVVNSAGNDRTNSWGHIIAPADADSILTVGAVSSTGSVTSFSSPGPTYDGRIKPDISALGLSVVCARPDTPTGYTAVGGTSLAAPLVAGGVALILEAHPDWTPAQVWDAVRFTASQANAPDNDLGYGIMNVDAAIDYNQSGGSGSGSTQLIATLNPIYPNPTRGDNSIIKWTVEQLAPVRVDVYNLLGQHVTTLFDRPFFYPGTHSVTWRGENSRGLPVPSGVYFVRLTAGNKTEVQRLVIRR